VKKPKLAASAQWRRDIQAAEGQWHEKRGVSIGGKASGSEM